jgi:hypothetical protein
MQSHDHERDDALRAKKRREASSDGPRAERPTRPVWASALGNAAVQRLLRSAGLHRSGGGAGAVDSELEQAIREERGAGQGLDPAVERKMGSALGDDFSDVRVHADDTANALNHAVRADAFTTGADIFFREGKYQPGGTDGERLLAHELTHVVQQRGAPAGGRMTVSSPTDASEREAAEVAHGVGDARGGGVADAVARQDVEEEELQMSPRLDRQDVEEEELQLSPRLDRQDEEEELQLSPRLDRQDEEEEEELQMSPRLDRQDEDEEEELQMSPADLRANEIEASSFDDDR